MKDKILELMRSPVPNSYALGFEFCAAHHPEWLIEIDREFSMDIWHGQEHYNYNQYARQFFAEDANVGDCVPCDKWDIEFKREKIFYSNGDLLLDEVVIRVLDADGEELARTNDYVYIEEQLTMMGWQ